MRVIILTFLFVFNLTGLEAQDRFRIKNKAGYSEEEIAPLKEAYELGLRALMEAHKEMDDIWETNKKGKEKWDLRMSRWNDNLNFTTWLGVAKEARQIRLAHRRLYKMQQAMDRKKVYIFFQSPDKSFNCKWSKHAWTVPKGRVAIHCCPQFMYLTKDHQSKAFVHEIGHESGLFFHQKVYWRRAAIRTAKERPIKAVKNPESFAYLVMEYYR